MENVNVERLRECTGVYLLLDRAEREPHPAPRTTGVSKDNLQQKRKGKEMLTRTRKRRVSRIWQGHPPATKKLAFGRDNMSNRLL